MEETQLFESEEVEAHDDLDIYTEEGIETFIDDDTISASEEGFMIGYLSA